MGEIIGLCIFHDGPGHVLTRDRDGLRSEPLGEAQALRNEVSLSLARPNVGGRFHMDRRPLRPQPIGQALGMAHDGVGAWLGVNED
jgi:hypothetical protein